MLPQAGLRYNHFMSTHTRSNAVIAFALLALFLFTLLPETQPAVSLGLLLLLALTIAIGLYGLQPRPYLLFTVGVLTFLAVLTSGLIVQLLPHTAALWLFFLLVGLTLAAVLRALAALVEGAERAFTQVSLTLEIASYALWMTLAAALRFTTLPLVVVFPILLLTGAGFHALALELRSGISRPLGGWMSGLLLAQLGSLALYLPLNALEYAALLTSLFHLLLTLHTAYEDNLPRGQTLRAALWLPALLLLALFWLE